MNYLLICCDQLRYDSLSIHGNTICHTPNLDRLAQEGVCFSNAYSTAPLCTPARGSIFTGNYAFVHGMGTNCDMYHSLAAELPDPSKLLHHAMQEQGYRCGYVGKWHVGTKLGPCDYGYEGMNVPGYGNCKAEPDFIEYLNKNNLSYNINNQIYYNGTKTLGAAIWDGPVESTAEWYLTDRTIQLIQEYREADSPFFVTCQYWGPHMPYTPPREWVGRADRSKIHPWKNFRDNLDTKPAFVRRHLDFYQASGNNWEDCIESIGLYYDYFMFIDDQIGRIYSYLEQNKLLDDTVILFSADHGDMQWAHGGLIDKGFLYEEAMHIPMLMRHPAFLGRGVCDELVSNIDLLATIRDDMGIPADCQGRSMLSVLRGEPAREDFYMEFHGIHFLYSQRCCYA